MIFAAPKMLWLLLVPATVAVWDLARRRRRGETNHPNILRAEAGPTSVTLASEKTKRPVDGAPRLRPWLWFGLAFAIVAIARPQWGRIEEPVFDQSREILLAVDLSRSMLAPDVSPSRLDRAKLLIQSLLEKLAGERVGLVVFAGTSFLQAPLSADYEILREFLPGLNPGFLPEAGTNYGAMLDAAAQAFGTTGAADRFLIVLSDGEATDPAWKDRIEPLKKRGVRVIGLGVGIDYALFIVTRYRENLHAGLEPEEAAVQAVDSSGRAGWVTLTTFVKVQIFVAAVDAIGIGVGAWILGLVFGGFPLVIPIAIAVFLGSFIPVVGAVLTPFSNIFEVKLSGTLDKPDWSFVASPTNFLRSLAPPETAPPPPPPLERPATTPSASALPRP